MQQFNSVLRLYICNQTTNHKNMKNIKSVAVTKPVYGLHVDAVLSRENSNDNFTYKSEYAGKDHSHKQIIELSESLLDKDHFVAIEWFAEKPLTNKERINALIQERDELSKVVLELEDKMQIADESYASLVESIDKQIKKFEDLYVSHYDNLKYATFFNEIDVDLTVYKNILTVLKGLK